MQTTTTPKSEIKTDSKHWAKSYRRPIAEIIADLSKTIPSKYLKRRRQQNTMLTYIPWYNASILLDRCAPGWSYTIDVTLSSDRIFVVASITIPSYEGDVTRQATGTELLKRINDRGEVKELAFGDPSSNAESMALRRAAAKFGLGLHLYCG